MNYEEAVGVSRVISMLQRQMLLNLDNWEPGPATDWNRGELVWKRLVEPAENEQSGYRLTNRGVEVRNALTLQAMSDAEILAALNAADGDGEQAEILMREMGHRGLLA